MHTLQRKLLDLAGRKNLGEHTLREIAEMVGEKSPQKMKHHLNQLEKKGLIRVDRINRTIEKRHQGLVSGLLKKAQLLAIPILGRANAGRAALFADQNIEGYLRISSTFLSKTRHKLFALKVVGPSMNRAMIQNKRIEDGDFVIVDAEARDPKQGDIVLSVIDGMANIKRFQRDQKNQQIALVSDSSNEFPPIYIHATDDFMINGKVVQVIKKPAR